MDSFGKVVNLPRTDAQIYMENKTVQGECKGIPVIAKTADDYVDANDIETTVIGHCEQFNLTVEEDRTAYADLLAKLAWSTNMEKHLEERTFVDNALIIYVAYLEYVKIAK